VINTISTSNTAKEDEPIPASNRTAAPMLECRDVERRFGGLVAVTGVDMHIRRGEIFGLKGPKRQRQEHHD